MLQEYEAASSVMLPLPEFMLSQSMSNVPLLLLSASALMCRFPFDVEMALRVVPELAAVVNPLLASSVTLPVALICTPTAIVIWLP